MTLLEAEDRAGIFVPHAFPERRVDLGEIRMNYARAGSADKPALLLIPPQTRPWWSYEKAMPLLADEFDVFAVDLRGQGRSTWTPGRYTLDNMGNDLVRFIDRVINRPVIVSGNSSGGVLSAWLSAYALPGQIRGAVYEDPPLFACEIAPAYGQGMRQSFASPMFALWNKWLGDQWSIGDWDGMQAAIPRELPAYVMAARQRMAAAIAPSPGFGESPGDPGPPQHMKEYDPEWARAFYTGTATAGCDHKTMLSAVKAPVLLTHHYRYVDPATGILMGAISDDQVRHAQALVTAAGQRFEVLDLPDMAHGMHDHDPKQFATTIINWAETLPA